MHVVQVDRGLSWGKGTQEEGICAMSTSLAPVWAAKFWILVTRLPMKVVITNYGVISF